MIINRYFDMHSDPVLGAYAYNLLKNSIEVFYIIDKKIVYYNTTPNTNNDLVISSSVMKPRVYPYYKNALIIVIGNNNYIYYSSDYADILNERTWNDGILDTSTLNNCLIPEDFDLYKFVIDKNDLSIKVLDPYYTSYQHTELGSNSIYRIQAILIDLVEKKDYDINKCYAYDNFIIYDKDDSTYELYPYEIEFNWNNLSQPIIINKIGNNVIYSNPNSYAYAGEIKEFTSNESVVYNPRNQYVFRGNLV